ncbi:TetR/AcrR family transcriptional regulator [uncultured Roseibium sp.]|uniref:TetR/AcrR family transcriptional regulator n=1 Tax=uncultured Roseibium sp. TaxID=1936171 RepID=UPI002632EAAF|nr:TetR/AcrR family transcriptional regulator [uncultured Roseibium sp.]
MRMSRQEAAKNRERVVNTASEMFREFGYDGIGIAGLMKASGLTNGAFYKQFESKEALIAEATAQAFADNATAWRKAVENAGGDALKAAEQWYLSEPHLNHRGLGCTLATLASEAPRHDEPVRRAFDEGIRTILELIADTGPRGDTSCDKNSEIRELCRLVGALSLARAVSDSGLAERILEANRGVKEFDKRQRKP